LDELSEVIDESGTMNYVISKLLHNWLIKKRLSYSVLNAAIGILECAKMELFRMVAAPYEQKKRLENGGVSNLDAINMEDVR
jgi:hypothetical protein